jgi:hypothetical protein
LDLVHKQNQGEISTPTSEVERPGNNGQRVRKMYARPNAVTDERAKVDQGREQSVK